MNQNDGPSKSISLHPIISQTKISLFIINKIFPNCISPEYTILLTELMFLLISDELKMSIFEIPKI